MTWMGIENLWAFLAAVLVFLALPGPGTFALLAGTARGGLRGGYATLAGLLLGDQLLLWLALAGLAALLQATPLLFHALQYLGVAYLLWIGLQLLRARGGEAAAQVVLAAGHDFRRGLLVTLLNPKAIMFYMAFLPLFIDPSSQRGLVTFATMAVLIALISVAYCSLLIVLGQVARRRLAQRPRVSLWLRRSAGICLIGFAARLGSGA